MTHDYKRHGTTSLFVADWTWRRARWSAKSTAGTGSQEVLRFLREVGEGGAQGTRRSSASWTTYATHKHRRVRDWAAGTGRVRFHFVPTSSSWLNLVERFFSTLTQKRIRRGVFHSVPHLESCLKQYIETYEYTPAVLVAVGRPDHREGGPGPQGTRSRLSIGALCFGPPH